MKDFAAENGSASSERDDHEAQWRELRELLTGPERRKVAEILERLNDPVRRAEELSRALPDAITLSRSRDKRLSNALWPAIDTALKTSVRKDPRPIAEAIFPVLGPAIRKAISATLLSMIQSLNLMLNQSFSIQGLRWRFEALRTRKPFAEIVLLHTLVYQVEQIFLIHRRTGLVLQHVAAADALVRDPDLVSGMLTAIQDFVKDAFESQTGETLDTLRMGGDHSIWIEQGPEAFLAVVLRGTPPLGIREDFRNLLAEIHQTFHAKWEEFDGQVAPFAMVQPQLENALTLEVHKPKQRTSPLLWLATVAILSFGALWVLQIQEQRQDWHEVLALLNEQSGIVVTAVRQESGRLYIEGLRDPLARDPRQFFAEAGIDPRRVESRWKPYQSLDPTMVLERAKRLLQPPPKVDIELDNRMLTVSGEASHDWVMKLHQLAPALAGVDAVEAQRLKDTQMEQMSTLAAKLSRQAIEFELGSASLAPDQQTRMLTVFSILSAMNELQQQFGIPVRVVVIGQSDPTGSDLFNMELSQNRALQVIRFLTEKGLDPTMFAAMGKGAGVTPLHAAPRQEVVNERRVTFRTFINGKEEGL